MGQLPKSPSKNAHPTTSIYNQFNTDSKGMGRQYNIKVSYQIIFMVLFRWIKPGKILAENLAPVWPAITVTSDPINRLA